MGRTWRRVDGAHRHGAAVREATCTGKPIYPSWAKVLPSTKNYQKEKQTNQQTMIHRDGNIFSLEMITRKTDLNEWIIVMIKEKQIELFFIGLRSSFYLDASLLLLVMGPLKSAD